MWLKYERIPPHFRRELKEFLYKKIEKRRIGRYVPLAWPSQSLELSPVEFFCGVA
jgi:hypothetical protein